MKTAEEILEKITTSQGISITRYISKEGFVWKMVVAAMEEYAREVVEEELKKEEG